LISCDVQDSTIIISFTDNGIGIEQQYLEQIFIMFTRLHASNEYSGTGLGLAICKKIVEKHGGSISVQSIPDEFTSFRICFPQAIIYQKFTKNKNILDFSIT